MAKIQPQSVGLAPELPRHIGIIMDGNGRYATRRGLPRKLGHRAGMERLRGLIRFSSDIGIEVLSLYAFSTENWKRPKEEIGALFDLFLEYFISELDDLDKNNVCIRIMGDMSAFPEKMGQETDEAMYKTRNNTGLKLNIALNYGSRAEVVRACNTLIEPDYLFCTKIRAKILFNVILSKTRISIRIQETLPRGKNASSSITID